MLEAFVYCWLVALCAGLQADASLTISNGVLTVGISEQRGGAISTLFDNNNPNLNLINQYDQGREVQQSYYAGPKPYRNATWMGQSWPWNPISAGDVAGNHGSVLQLQQNATSIYVKSRPLQWALENVSCNCTFETFITLDANGVYVRNRLNTFREDSNVYRPMSQELPAVYVIGRFSNMWAGRGAAYEPVQYPVPGPPWGRFAANASWAAFTDSSDHRYGVGVSHPGLTTFLGGFAGTPSPRSTTFDAATAYLAPIDSWQIHPSATRTYCFRLAIGYLETIKSYFMTPHRQRDDCEFPEMH